MKYELDCRLYIDHYGNYLECENSQKIHMIFAAIGTYKSDSERNISLIVDYKQTIMETTLSVKILRRYM